MEGIDHVVATIILLLIGGIALVTSGLLFRSRSLTVTASAVGLIGALFVIIGGFTIAQKARGSVSLTPVVFSDRLSSNKIYTIVVSLPAEKGVTILGVLEEGTKEYTFFRTPTPSVPNFTRFTMINEKTVEVAPSSVPTDFYGVNHLPFSATTETSSPGHQ